MRREPRVRPQYGPRSDPRVPRVTLPVPQTHVRPTWPATPPIPSVLPVPHTHTRPPPAPPTLLPVGIHTVLCIMCVYKYHTWPPQTARKAVPVLRRAAREVEMQCRLRAWCGRAPPTAAGTARARDARGGCGPEPEPEPTERPCVFGFGLSGSKVKKTPPDPASVRLRALPYPYSKYLCYRSRRSHVRPLPVPSSLPIS